MATMEDRLMGEKLHYYCSSSEGEDEEDDEGRVDDDSFDVEKSKQAQADKIAERAYMEVSGNSSRYQSWTFMHVLHAVQK